MDPTTPFDPGSASSPGGTTLRPGAVAWGHPGDDENSQPDSDPLNFAAPAEISARLPAAIGEANTFRVIFFVLTFFSIGMLSNFRRLWQEGVGKLAAVYLLSLFGFVIWVGLAISWLFFGGVHPPLAS